MPHLTTEEAEHLRQSFSAWLQLEPFLDHLRFGNRSPATIREYRKCLELYFFETRNLSVGITTDELRRWVAAMRDRGLKPKSISSRLTVLGSFFNFLRDQEIVTSNPISKLPKVKIGKRLPKTLTLEETRTFLDTVRAQAGGRHDRDITLFALLYTCGLRVAEVCTLRVEDVNLDAATIRILGKGDKERSVYLKEEMIALLRPWLGDRVEGWVFAGQEPGSHLATRTVEHHCREYGKAANLSRRMHPHILRHSCAVHHLMAGAPVSYVQSLLGHSSLATTGRYLELADSQRRKIAAETKLAI